MSTSQKETRPPEPAEAAPGPAPSRLRRVLRRSPTSTLPPQGSLRWSFTWAFEGIVYVLRTQRNMQIHVGAAVVALVLGLLLDFSRLELAAIMGAISLVLVAEMMNTAVEAAIDAVVTSYHPLVKIAKDVAAGAVLVASVVAATIGYLVFLDRIRSPTYHLVNEVRAIPANLTIIALALTVIAVIAVKAISGRGTPLSGGLPSGHAALAFGGWMAITLVAADFQHRVLISTLGFLMAFLVAQTRVESGIHTTLEVTIGAVLGTLVTLVLFQTLT